MLNKRVISAIVALPLLFGAIIFSSRVFFAALCIVTSIGLYEYFSAVRKSSIKPMTLVGMISGLLMLFLMFNSITFKLIVPFITLLTVLLLSAPVFLKQYSFWGAGATIIGILYIPHFFGYLYLIRAIPDIGVYLIWFVIISSWFTDTFAYFAGMLFGKTKLCPSISPKKTVEGSVGGIIGSSLGCLIYGIIINNFGILSVSPVNYLFMGVLGSIISQIGDLAASSIKRNVGIKDYGKIMPGHGGVLDRFDSILFVSPLIYYYITYFLY